MRKAILRNMITGSTVLVTLTQKHPMSSYGIPVWVSEEGDCYGERDNPALGYEILVPHDGGKQMNQLHNPVGPHE